MAASAVQPRIAAAIADALLAALPCGLEPLTTALAVLLDEADRPKVSGGLAPRVDTGGGVKLSA